MVIVKSAILTTSFHYQNNEEGQPYEGLAPLRLII